MNGQTDDKSREKLPLKELAKQEQTVKTVQGSQEDEHEERLKIRTYYDEDLEGTATELLDELCEYSQDMLGGITTREQMIKELIEWHHGLTGDMIKITGNVNRDVKTIFEETGMLKEVIK